MRIIVSLPALSIAFIALGLVGLYLFVCLWFNSLLVYVLIGSIVYLFFVYFVL